VVYFQPRHTHLEPGGQQPWIAPLAQRPELLRQRARQPLVHRPRPRRPRAPQADRLQAIWMQISETDWRSNEVRYPVSLAVAAERGARPSPSPRCQVEEPRAVPAREPPCYLDLELRDHYRHCPQTLCVWALQGLPRLRPRRLQSLFVCVAVAFDACLPRLKPRRLQSLSFCLAVALDSCLPHLQPLRLQCLSFCLVVALDSCLPRLQPRRLQCLCFWPAVALDSCLLRLKPLRLWRLSFCLALALDWQA
jgi:hypothetical protein